MTQHTECEALSALHHTTTCSPPKVVHLGDEEGVRLVDLPQPLQHLWQLRRVDWLHCYLHYRLGRELEGAEDVGLEEGQGVW